MKKLTFAIDIDAAVETVYACMLGLSDKSTYEQWTALFNPTSSYLGDWSEGSKMQFVGVDENGDTGGVVSRIVKNMPNAFVSIQHYGLVQAGKEILEGPEVEQWANGFENYSFTAVGDGTRVEVNLDMNDAFEDYMNETYPKALVKLKEICEKGRY
ncbi:MAG: SRPBCC domain-containing protein [Bacteroidia bacterium]|jgi:hypothetical protein|nr:SRPBCC domain-containing protein [Bacteroidia bacterium]